MLTAKLSDNGIIESDAFEAVGERKSDRLIECGTSVTPNPRPISWQVTSPPEPLKNNMRPKIGTEASWQGHILRFAAFTVDKEMFAIKLRK